MSLLQALIPIAVDSEGRTVPDALLYSYDVGTNTPKDTYSNVGLTVPNANPLQSDGSGRFFNVYLGAGGYKLVLRDSNDVVLWTQDNYYQSLDGSDLTAIDADIAQVDQNLSQTFFIGTDVGVADAYDLDPAGVETLPTAYGDSMIIAFNPANANTGASTVRIGALAIKDLVNSDGSPLTAGFLTPGAIYQFAYVLGQFYFFFKSGMVTTSTIEDLAVTTAKLASNAVTTAKILDKNVTLGKIADGTANKLIGYDSSGVATQWSNPMRLLASGSLTATASLQFVLSTLDASQSVDNGYLIRLVGIQPATDDQELWLTLSTDAGSTYAATAYYSSTYGYTAGLAGQGQNYSNGAQIIVAGASGAGGSLSNAANETCTVEVELYYCNTGTSVEPHIRTAARYYMATGVNYAFQNGSGTRSTTGDYDAVKFTWEGGGNFAAVGKYYIFKIPNVT